MVVRGTKMADWSFDSSTAFMRKVYNTEKKEKTGENHGHLCRYHWNTDLSRHFDYFGNNKIFVQDVI